jgi:hypothetical protein
MPRVRSNNTFLSEHQEQVESVAWFRKHYTAKIIAIPNGGARSRSEGARLKAEGVTAGVHDLFIPAWLLWAEMKRSDGGSGLSEKQKEWADYVDSIGHHWIVCNGFNDFKKKILLFTS